MQWMPQVHRVACVADNHLLMFWHEAVWIYGQHISTRGYCRERNCLIKEEEKTYSLLYPHINKDVHPRLAYLHHQRLNYIVCISLTIYILMSVFLVSRIKSYVRGGIIINAWQYIWRVSMDMRFFDCCLQCCVNLQSIN